MVGVTTAVQPGLWEYVYSGSTGTDGEWYRHVPQDVVHHDVIGQPTGTPEEDEFIATNRDGDLFPVIHTVTDTTVAAAAESEAFTDTKYFRSPDTLAHLFNQAGAWGFYAPAVDTASNTFTQSGASLGQVNYGVIWVTLWQNIIDGTNPDAARMAVLVALRDATFLGAHRNDLQAAQHMTRLGIGATEYTAGSFYYTLWGSINFGVRRITQYTAGASTETETRHYGERLASIGDVLAEIAEAVKPKPAVLLASHTIVTANGNGAWLALASEADKLAAINDSDTIEIRMKSGTNNQIALVADFSGSLFNALNEVADVEISANLNSSSLQGRSSRRFEGATGNGQGSQFYLARGATVIHAAMQWANWGTVTRVRDLAHAPLTVARWSC